MGFWRRNRDEFEEMADLIEDEPGITQSELARRMDVSKSTILRRLPVMEESGVLLSEDEQGGLWLFRRKK